MSQTLRSLIQTLERAASQSPQGDRAPVLVEAPVNIGGHGTKEVFETKGAGLAAGARYDRELEAIVIEVKEVGTAD